MGTGAVSQQDVDRVGLSPEELAGLEQDDIVQHDPSRPSKAEVEALEREFKKGDDDDGNADADAEAKKKAEEEQAAAKKAEEEAAAAKKKEEEEAAAAAAKKVETTAASAEPDEPFAPGYEAPAVEDYDKKVADIEGRIKAAEVEFKAGNKTFDEFREIERAANEERRKLDEARLKHEISNEQSEQRAAARWNYECNRFFADTAKNEGINYKAPENRALWAALDHEVKELAKDEAHGDKSGSWFLAEAHRRIKTQFNLGKAAPADDPAAKAAEEARKKREAEEAAARERKGAKPAATQTLQGLPNAEADKGADKDEFAHLDGLTGMDLERALARMAPEDAERYLRAA